MSILRFKNIFMMALLITLTVFLFFWNSVGVLSLSDTASEKNIAEDVKAKICHVNLKDTRTYVNGDTNLKMIYYVTPTYPRPEQIAELTRLSHTLMHIPIIHWIVADDQPLCSEEVNTLLIKTGLPFTHISSPKPFTYKQTNFPRGVANRQAALAWLRDSVQSGVLYFGDDDNAVDLELFSEIRQTKKVSMFPVGLIGTFGVSSPIVKDGKVVGFFDSWPASRTFPVDMAGFAVNIEYLKPTAHMPYIAGHEEDRFLVSTGLKVEDIQPLANNCTKILVWHTRTSKYKKPTVRIDIKKLESIANYETFTQLLKETSRLGMATFNANEGIKPYITRNRKTYKTIAGFK